MSSEMIDKRPVVADRIEKESDQAWAQAGKPATRNQGMMMMSTVDSHIWDQKDLSAKKQAEGLTPAPVLPRSVEDQILRAVRGLRYGSVEIIVHDGKPVQIERREKVRFET
jgi:hypothetical protein